MSLAGTCAMSSVEETRVVASAVPFHSTVEVPVKAVPRTVSMKAGPPTVTLVGETEFSAKTGGVMVNVSALLGADAAGSVTVTDALPGATISAADICAVNCVALTKVVGCELPFQSTVDCWEKPEPVTVRVKEEPPAITLDGDIELSTRTTGVTVKFCKAEVPFTGSFTETEKVPGEAICAADICVVNCVPLTKFVGIGEPSQSTVDCWVKPKPVTVSVKDGPPAAAEDGLSEVIPNVDFVTVYWT